MGAETGEGMAVTVTSRGRVAVKTRRGGRSSRESVFSRASASCSSALDSRFSQRRLSDVSSKGRRTQERRGKSLVATAEPGSSSTRDEVIVEKSKEFLALERCEIYRVSDRKSGSLTRECWSLSGEVSGDPCAGSLLFNSEETSSLSRTTRISSFFWSRSERPREGGISRRKRVSRKRTFSRIRKTFATTRYSSTPA